MTADARQLEQLSAYLDGELSAEESAQVERLLAQDESARHLLAQLRRTSQLVSTLPRESAPANLSQQITARLERSALLDKSPTSQTIRAPRRSRPFAIAASLILAVTATWMAWISLVTPPTANVSNHASLESAKRDQSVELADSTSDAKDKPLMPAPPASEQLAFAEKNREIAAPKEAEPNPMALTLAKKESAPAGGAADSAMLAETRGAGRAAPHNKALGQAGSKTGEAASPAMTLKPESPPATKDLPDQINIEVNANDVTRLVANIKSNLDEQYFARINADKAEGLSLSDEAFYAIMESPPNEANKQRARHDHDANEEEIVTSENDESDNSTSSKKSATANLNAPVRIVVNLPRDTSEKYLSSLNTLILANGATIQNENDTNDGTVARQPTAAFATNMKREESNSATPVPGTKALDLATTQAAAPVSEKKKTRPLGSIASTTEHKRDLRDDAYHTITIVIHPRPTSIGPTKTVPARSTAPHSQIPPASKPAEGASGG